MALDTISPEEKTELDLLEKRLAKRARLTRYVVMMVVTAVVALGAWLASGVATYTPPEPTPLEKLLTTEFSALQLEWFDTIAASARVNERMLADRQEQFMNKAEEFLARVDAVEPSLHEPFAGLLETMRASDQFALLAESPDDVLAEPVAALNEALKPLVPRFVLDAESFEGLMGEDYLVGAMLVVYEVLSTTTFRSGDQGDPFDLLIVRRRDSLPADGRRHGYVRRDDTSLAFVLQDNATAYVADTIFPSFERKAAAFEKAFGHDVPDELKEPYGVLLELVQLELRNLAGVEPDYFTNVAANVARRARIFKRAEEAAAQRGLHLAMPDGLVWPRSYASEVLMANTEANKKGEKVLYDQDKDDLIAISRVLADEEADRLLVSVARGVARSVAFHEARHVVDVGNAVEAGRCVLDRVRIVDRDPEFLRSVELECRAALTEVIAAPETVRLSLLMLLNHLYTRSGTSRFYAARTVLHPLVFEKDEKEIPRGWRYVEELTLRLAAATPEQLKEKAVALYDECFGGYAPLIIVEETEAAAAGTGCSASGF